MTDPWALPLVVRVPGSAVPQARAGRRIIPPGPGRPFPMVQSYDPPPVRDWKRTCIATFVSARGDRPLLAEGPVSLLLRFQLLRPKSLPRRVTRPDRKPDLDNLAKAVMDAARGILFRDDGQVVDLILAKSYALEPGVEVWIGRAEPAAASSPLRPAEPELFPVRDGLYQVTTSYLCAGFVIQGGRVTLCAPILRKRFAYWCTVARWLGP